MITENVENNNNTNEVPKIADEEKDEETVESLCSDCVRELETEAIENVVQVKYEPSVHFNSEVNEIFAEGLDEVETLSQAMSTLSQLSIDCPFVDINFETDSVIVVSGDNINNNQIKNEETEMSFVNNKDVETNFINMNKENVKNTSYVQKNHHVIENQNENEKNANIDLIVQNSSKKSCFNEYQGDNTSVNNFNVEFDKQLEEQFENFHEEFDQQLEEQLNNFDKEFNEHFELEKQKFSDKAIQVNNVCTLTDENQKEPEYWDPEFPSVAELDQINTIINKEPISTNPQSSKCKRKLTFDDNNKSKIAKKSKEIKKPDVNAISSIKINREKSVLELSNDLFELSSYLDALKEAALNSKQFYASVKNISPPTLVGYDTQFDSVLQQNRFTKLPIRVKSANISDNNNNSKIKDLNEPLSKYPRVKILTNKNFNSKSKHAKGNDRNIKIAGKTYYQSTIEEAFNSGNGINNKSQVKKIEDVKSNNENQENLDKCQGNKINNAGIKNKNGENLNKNQENKIQYGLKDVTPSIKSNLNQISSIAASHSSSDGKSYDSIIMDEYNPLRNTKTAFLNRIKK